MKDFFIRLITSVFLVAAVVGAFLLRELVDNNWMLLLFAFFAVIGSFETVRALKDKLTWFSKCVIAAFSLSIAPAFAFFGVSAAITTLLSAAILLFGEIVFNYDEVTVEKTACGLFGLFYPTALLIPLFLLNDLGDKSFTALALTFLISPAADASAYVVGSIVKGPKLCEKITAKKTISGAIGGLLGGVLVSVLFWAVCAKGMLFSNVTAEVITFMILGLFGALFTELGDLIESGIKRKLGIKDMGKIFPGHGGMLDRIDGITVCAIFVYLVFAFIG